MNRRAPFEFLQQERALARREAAPLTRLIRIVGAIVLGTSCALAWLLTHH